MGFTKTDIGLIAKHAGLWPAVIGALLGGLWMVRLGINRALWLFGVVQLVSIFGFAWLSTHGHYVSIGAGERLALAFVIGLEALGLAWVQQPSLPSSPVQLTLLTPPPRWRYSPAWLQYHAPSSTHLQDGWLKLWVGQIFTDCA